jgi:hypothetical protein
MVLFCQVLSIFLFITKSSDRLQPVLVLGKIPQGGFDRVLASISHSLQGDPVFPWRFCGLHRRGYYCYSHGKLSWHNLGRLGNYDYRVGLDDHPR